MREAHQVLAVSFAEVRKYSSIGELPDETWRPPTGRHWLVQTQSSESLRRGHRGKWRGERS
jgi:hypothetical protein